MRKRSCPVPFNASHGAPFQGAASLVPVMVPCGADMAHRAPWQTTCGGLICGTWEGHPTPAEWSR